MKKVILKYLKKNKKKLKYFMKYFTGKKNMFFLHHYWHRRLPHNASQKDKLDQRMALGWIARRQRGRV